jgi:hypothetical protein
MSASRARACGDAFGPIGGQQAHGSQGAIHLLAQAVVEVDGFGIGRRRLDRCARGGVQHLVTGHDDEPLTGHGRGILGQGLEQTLGVGIVTSGGQGRHGGLLGVEVVRGQDP